MKFDWKTALVVLGAVALGYAICLAMPVARAGGGRFPAVVDHLLVIDYIEFANGVRLTASGDRLISSGPIQANRIMADYIVANQNIEARGYIYAYDWTGAQNYLRSDGYIWANDSIETGSYFRGSYYRLGPTIFVSSTHVLQGLTIASDVLGGASLDVDKLNGYPASEFVLKSEIGPDFCQTFCPILTKSD